MYVRTSRWSAWFSILLRSSFSIRFAHTQDNLSGGRFITATCLMTGSIFYQSVNHTVGMVLTSLNVRPMVHVV